MDDRRSGGMPFFCLRYRRTRMLDNAMKTQLKAYLERVVRPIGIKASVRTVKASPDRWT